MAAGRSWPWGLLMLMAACKPTPAPTVAPRTSSVAAAPTVPAPAPVALAATPTTAAAVAAVPWLDPPSSPREGYKRPKIIDFHGHLSLDGADRLAQIMAENGIERMVNLSGGSFRRGPEAWESARMLTDALHGTVINFMNPDWMAFAQPGWGEREAARLQDAVLHYGFAGLKIAKVLGLGLIDENTNGLVPADDPRLSALWAKCAELGVPAAIHVADPRAFWWPLNPQNERWEELRVHPGWAYGPIPPELAAQLPERPPTPSWPALLQSAERLYRANPRTTFVAVHFGNAAEDLEYVDGLLTHNDNVYIDLAARVGEFGRHPAQKLRDFFVKWQDRIVFGTDIGVGSDFLMLGSNGEVEPQLPDVRPFYVAHFRFLESADRQMDHPSPIQGNWKVDAIDLPDAVLAKIYRENALRLLDRGRLQAFAKGPHRQLQKVALGLANGAQPKPTAIPPSAPDRPR